jgi:cytochrome c-type biogenesis protein CcmH/NrfG
VQNSGNNDCFGNVRALERRDFFKRWARRLAVCVLALVLVGAGYFFYGGWRKRHLSQQAQDFFAQKDYASAVLVARHVLQLDPRNVTACRLMAEIAELSGKQEALSWREQVATLEADVAANRIALASTALRFRQIEVARRNLDSIPTAARTNIEYHQIAGALALAEKNLTAAEAEFAAALQLAPGNAQLALNVATIRLTSGDPAIRDKAAAELQQLAENPALRLEALRSLASGALANKSPAAVKWAGALRTEKGVTFSDFLLYLEAAQNTDAHAAVLRDTQELACRSAATAASLITWMNRHALAQPALEWALSLPKQILTAPPVPLAVAETYSFLQDWNGLQAWVEGKNWGEDECLRLAALSHALHRLTPGDRASMESQTAWAAALKATRNRPQRLAAIAQLAEGWGYSEEAADAWWLIANGNENAKQALTALQRLYKAKQNSHGLLRVAKRALELNPSDLIAANNCASLGLLLTGDSSARRLATKLHAENPSDPTVSSTYAFGLFTEGRAREALAQMETLKEPQLRHPVIAAYYFVMLVENGKMEQAHSFLSAANKALLLPEELQLFTAATRKLLQHDSQTVIKTVANG